MKPDTRWIWVGVLMTVIGVNGLVLHKEWILRTGRPLLLELAPVDPRSMIQGDYMRLRYQVARDAGPVEQRTGALLLRVDEQGIGRYLGRDQPPVGPGQLVLRYRRGPGGEVQAGAGAFFFQEGLAEGYARAKYGEFRVGSSGEAVLVGLRN